LSPRRSALWLAVATACAGVPRGGEGVYAFPDAFVATQAVTVTLDSSNQDLVASLSRRGPDLEVTLFDPVFAFPVLTASVRAGVANEVRHADSVRPGDGERLVRLLVAVYEMQYSDTAGVGDASTPTLRLRLEGLPGEGACRFPDAIEVSPRFGGGPRVRVRTLDVACDAESAGR
jgi:hypothetical protein